MMNETDLMSFEHFNHPFSHYIVSNVFCPNMLETIKNIFKTENKWIPYTLQANRKDCKERFSVDLCKYPEIYEYLLSYKQLILQKCNLDLEKRKDILKSCEFNILEAKICMDRKGYRIDKHCDTLRKRITMIIYLNNEGSTTTLYDNNKKNEYDIEKKENTALVFVPQTNKSWHCVKETVEERHSIQLFF